jgi:hypothetical protein
LGVKGWKLEGLEKNELEAKMNQKGNNNGGSGGEYYMLCVV